MASYRLITLELLEGLYNDLKAAVPEMPCLKSDQGARRNLIRLILKGGDSTHVRPLPVTSEDMERQAAETTERLRFAERLLKRCLPLIVEGGRYVEQGSATDAVERFLKTAYREGES